MRAIAQHMGLLIGQLVHPAARGDADEFSRHRAFIASHLSGGLIALCFLPVFLAVYGQPRLFEALAFVWFISPIAIAVLLSMTGRYQLAHVASSLNLCALIVFGACYTGGTGSFLLPWLIVVPIEAALSWTRGIVIVSTSLACLAALVILAIDQAGLASTLQAAVGNVAMLSTLGVSFAIVYAGSVALSIHSVYRGNQNRVQRQNMRFVKTLEDSASLVTWHALDGMVREVSGKVGDLDHDALSALRGDGMLERVHLADRPAFLTTISRAGQSDAPVRVEYRLATQPEPARERKAQYEWVETICSAAHEPRSGSQPERVGVVAVTRSIDTFKAREFALIAARDEADINAAAKNAFIRGLSHELRTPLNAMLGFSSLLSGDAGVRFTPEQQREYATIIHTSGQSLLRFVDEISVIAKLESGTLDLDKEEVELGALLEDAVGDVRQQAIQRGISVTCNLGFDGVTLNADADALAKAFSHILDNAMKYCGSGGRISLQLRRHGNDVIVSISDTGSGIARTALPNVTRAFFKADPQAAGRKNGAGLGLAYAKGIVELHGGQLELDSELGGGTCVTVRLLLEAADESDRNPAPLTVLPARKTA